MKHINFCKKEVKKIDKMRNLSRKIQEKST